LREALINVVCHRDYTILSNIEIRIYDGKLVVWSPGGLPFGITLEELYKPHSSTLRNKGLAEVFYDTELIEQWGSGIEKMRKYCLGAGLPEPTFEEYQGFQVVFRKDIYDEEYLYDLNLNERQIKAVMYVKGTGTKKITNKEYQDVCDTSKRTSSRDLADLVASGLFEQIGTTGKGTVYVLRRHKAPQRRQNNHENLSPPICIHRTAHNDQPIETFEIWQGVVLVEMCVRYLMSLCERPSISIFPSPGSFDRAIPESGRFRMPLSGSLVPSGDSCPAGRTCLNIPSHQ